MGEGLRGHRGKNPLKRGSNMSAGGRDLGGGQETGGGRCLADVLPKAVASRNSQSRSAPPVGLGNAD